MYGDSFFLQAFVYLCAAVIAVPLAQRLGLGSVLGYLVAGMAIGSSGLGLVGAHEGEAALHFSEFGVVMMLFVVGLELEPATLWRLRTPILGMGGLQVVATGLAVALLALGGGLSVQESVAVGLILAMSSTAIVLQSLAERNMLGSPAGRSSFAVLLFQDIAVIPMLALFPLLATHPKAGGGEGHAPSWVETLPAWGQGLVVLAAVASVVLGGRFLMRPALRAIARTRLRELFVASVLLLVIGIALLMSRVGLSPALGTFIAGVVLADSEYRHELESDIEPFKGLLLGLFFMAVGASLDFELVAAQPVLVGGVVVALVLVKLAVLLLVAVAFRLPIDQGLLFAFALAQGGEFAFVLFSFAAQGGVLELAVTKPLVASVAMSMALTPLLMLVYERLVAPRFQAGPDPRDFDAPEAGAVIIAGFGRFGQICGRLLDAEGVEVTVLEHDSDQVDLLRKFGRKVYYGDACRLDLLEAAGAHEAKLIILAIDKPEKTLELVRTVKRHFPKLRILARARSRVDAYELVEEGVDHVYRETFDTAIRVGVDALRLLGSRGHRAHRAGQRFRRYDEALLRELAHRRRDDDFMAVARRRNDEVAAVLRSDMSDQAHLLDEGWDPESLRQSVKAPADDVGVGAGSRPE